ncbi:MAG: HD domain-containing protein [Nitrospinae bacterium]|nr:HD domain-containing protein [Nitrospinota bacterium]
MVNKRTHEIRDPIHVFIRLDSDERKVLDSPPFQRLRHIHQLALTYLVYPGATHKRFEHSLGVMELASRIYDVVTDPENIYQQYASVRDIIPIYRQFDHLHWRRTLRLAALCHDLGHLPFSHVSEELLPEDWDHERMTMEIILGKELADILRQIHVQPEDVAKLVIGPKKSKAYLKVELNEWENILSEIITGDVFGADRMDYLLRDSYHAGVAYGKFDHYRLIDTMRVLPKQEAGGSQEPVLGVEEGGLESAEALLLARYFMFSQIYFHPVRLIYDEHLLDFLKSWLDKGLFPTDWKEHLKYTDNEVISAMLSIAQNKSHPAHIHADRIVNRRHFRSIYRSTAEDRKLLEPGKKIYEAASEKFGEENVKHVEKTQTRSVSDFPVLVQGTRIAQAASEKETFEDVTSVYEHVFVSAEMKNEANTWLLNNREGILSSAGGG